MEEGEMKTLKERFLEKVNKTKTCWLWIGCLNSSKYGQIRVNGRTRGAHQISYELFVGEIKDKLWVLHKCDVPNCVNPNHLFLGDVVANTQDMISKNRDKGCTSINRKMTNCKNGHEFTSENTYYYDWGKRGKHRVCKSCVIARSKIKQLARKIYPNNSEKTHCIHGHEFTVENTILERNGRKRTCRICNRLRGRISDLKRSLRNKTITTQEQ